MRDSWYLRQAGVESGPVKYDTITDWARSGRIQPSDELRRSDQQFWQAASEFAGLFDAPAEGDADDDMFGDILGAAAADDGSHESGERVGVRLEDQLGYDPHHPSIPVNVEVQRYYCRVRGQEAGPFTIEELQQRADQGLFSPFDRVRSEEGKAWVPAQEISEIRFAPPAPRAVPVVDDDREGEETPPSSAARIAGRSDADNMPASSASRPSAPPLVATSQLPAEERKRPISSSSTSEVATRPSRVKVSSPKRARSISMPKLDFKMPSGTLIAAFIGVLLLALFVWWVMRPGEPMVTGRATVDEQPIPSGSISFRPIDGTQGIALSLPIVQGEFEGSATDELGNGTYHVTVLIGNSLGPPPPELSAVPAFKSLNGATFETQIDTSAGDEELFVFDFAASEARIDEPDSGNVLSPDGQ